MGMKLVHQVWDQQEHPNAAASQQALALSCHHIIFLVGGEAALGTGMMASLLDSHPSLLA